jgi:hypothetical protein
MRLADCKDSAHPVWGFGRLCTILVALIVILHISATAFDANEIYTLIIVMVSGASAEGASAAFGKPANHPAWGFARLVAVMVTLITTLYMTATNFDDTEVQSIVILFLVAAGVESVTGIVRKFQNKAGKS